MRIGTKKTFVAVDRQPWWWPCGIMFRLNDKYEVQIRLGYDIFAGSHVSSCYQFGIFFIRMGEDNYCKYDQFRKPNQEPNIFQSEKL